VLHSVSLELGPGELVAVWGRRRSGRSTLLRVAAGVEDPTDGIVRFGGVDMTKRPMLGVPQGTGYSTAAFPEAVGRMVFEQVIAPLLGQGAEPADARNRDGSEPALARTRTRTTARSAVIH
jgi:ABC-type hemin transport system ATPase subunit